jgi:hypothetical protein
VLEDVDSSTDEYTKFLSDVFASRLQYKNRLSLAAAIVEESKVKIKHLYSTGDFQEAEKLSSSVANTVYDFTINNKYIKKNLGDKNVLDMVLNLERGALSSLGSNKLHDLVGSVLEGNYSKSRNSLSSRAKGVVHAPNILDFAENNYSFNKNYKRSDSWRVTMEEKAIVRENELLKLKKDKINAPSLVDKTITNNFIQDIVNPLVDNIPILTSPKKKNMTYAFLDYILWSANLRTHLTIPNMKRRDYITDGFGVLFGAVADIPRTLSNSVREIPYLAKYLFGCLKWKRKKSVNALFREWDRK